MHNMLFSEGGGVISKGFLMQSKAYDTVSHSVNHQIIRKYLNKVMIFF